MKAIVTALKSLWAWMTHVNMTKVVLGFVIIGWGLFFAAQATEEGSAYGALPLGTALSALMALQLYLIDRWGFRKVNTIQLLQSNGWLYVAYMALYMVAGVAGYVLAFAFSHF